MSSGAKGKLIETVGTLVMRFQDAAQKFDAEVGRLHDLNATELHCLSFLWRQPQTASAIAREVRLTPAAVTALIDRLERRGYVRRQADAGDRRKVLVAAAEKAEALTAASYLPMAKAGARMLSRYSETELRSFARLLEDSIALQEKAALGLARQARVAGQVAPSARRRAGTGRAPGAE